MKDRLQDYIDHIRYDRLAQTCETLLDNEALFTWPASLSFHHAYEGGLVAHTLEVVEIGCGIGMARSQNDQGLQFPAFDESVFIAAALWHDLMKIEEYITVPEFPGSQRALYRSSTEQYWTKDEAHTKMFGHHSHIIASASRFDTAAINHGVNQVTRNAVIHCILAHHGPVKEWGYPVAPVSLEALILHQADCLSAKFGATKEVAS